MRDGISLCFIVFVMLISRAGYVGSGEGGGDPFIFTGALFLDVVTMLGMLSLLMEHYGWAF